jgi:hypothetical protein
MKRMRPMRKILDWVVGLAVVLVIATRVAGYLGAYSLPWLWMLVVILGVVGLMWLDGWFRQKSN